MKVLAWLIIAVLLVGAVVAVAQAGLNWWEVSRVVDEAIQSAGGSETRASSRWSASGSDAAERVRTIILRDAAKAGITLPEHRVAVAQDAAGLRVSVRWTYPVLTVRDETVVAIPLSIDRSYRRP